MRPDRPAMSAPSPQPVPYVDLGAQYAEERDELLPLVDRMLASGAYVGGAAMDELEARLGRRCHVRHAVALASGTDALILAMRALGLGPGDEVITPPNSFVASTAAIVHVGATPVFADIRDDQNIDPERVAAAVTPRTRAIMPVHLTRLDALIRRRRAHVELYRSLLDPRHVFWPPERQIEFNTYHTFVVQVDRRDELQRHLAERGIGTAIHYPIPIHLQPAAQNLGYKRGDFPVTERQAERIIDLPIHQTLKPDQIIEVAPAGNRFLTA